mmetsp:Transcript_28077/g.90699  ORF Transcript_28077/g.90699 Transcript_28077/m.90699 type:complete len:1114 (-) Transcript_28077:265-3606(-)
MRASACGTTSSDRMSSDTPRPAPRKVLPISTSTVAITRPCTTRPVARYRSSWPVMYVKRHWPASSRSSAANCSDSVTVIGTPHTGKGPSGSDTSDMGAFLSSDWRTSDECTGAPPPLHTISASSRSSRPDENSRVTTLLAPVTNMPANRTDALPVNDASPASLSPVWIADSASFTLSISPSHWRSSSFARFSRLLDEPADPSSFRGGSCCSVARISATRLSTAATPTFSVSRCGAIESTYPSTARSADAPLGAHSNTSTHSSDSDLSLPFSDAALTALAVADSPLRRAPSTPSVNSRSSTAIPASRFATGQPRRCSPIMNALENRTDSSVAPESVSVPVPVPVDPFCGPSEHRSSSGANRCSPSAVNSPTNLCASVSAARISLMDSSSGPDSAAARSSCDTSPSAMGSMEPNTRMASPSNVPSDAVSATRSRPCPMRSMRSAVRTTWSTTRRASAPSARSVASSNVGASLPPDCAPPLFPNSADASATSIAASSSELPVPSSSGVGLITRSNSMLTSAPAACTSRSRSSALFTAAAASSSAPLPPSSDAINLLTASSSSDSDERSVLCARAAERATLTAVGPASCRPAILASSTCSTCAMHVPSSGCSPSLASVSITSLNGDPEDSSSCGSLLATTVDASCGCDARCAVRASTSAMEKAIRSPPRLDWSLNVDAMTAMSSVSLVTRGITLHTPSAAVVRPTTTRDGTSDLTSANCPSHCSSELSCSCAPDHTDGSDPSSAVPPAPVPSRSCTSSRNADASPRLWIALCTSSPNAATCRSTVGADASTTTALALSRGSSLAAPPSPPLLDAPSSPGATLGSATCHSLSHVAMPALSDSRFSSASTVTASAATWRRASSSVSRAACASMSILSGAHVIMPCACRYVTPTRVSEISIHLANSNTGAPPCAAAPWNCCANMARSCSSSSVTRGRVLGDRSSSGSLSSSAPPVSACASARCISANGTTSCIAATPSCVCASGALGAGVPVGASLDASAPVGASLGAPVGAVLGSASPVCRATVAKMASTVACRSSKPRTTSESSPNASVRSGSDTGFTCSMATVDTSVLYAPPASAFTALNSASAVRYNDVAARSLSVRASVNAAWIAWNVLPELSPV